MLTRKLAYSIYCFLLSSVEFILKKEKIVPETVKKSGLICIKVLLQIHSSLGREEGCLFSENIHILMVLL